MDQNDHYGNKEEQKVDIEDIRPDQIHIAILTQLATLQANVGHLAEMFAEHREERSKLGVRVGDLEKAVPDKLQDRLGKIEIRIGQIGIISAVAGGIVGVVSPLAWGEISKRMDAPPPIIHRTMRP